MVGDFYLTWIPFFPGLLIFLVDLSLLVFLLFYCGDFDYASLWLLSVCTCLWPFNVISFTMLINSFMSFLVLFSSFFTSSSCTFISWLFYSRFLSSYWRRKTYVKYRCSMACVLSSCFLIHSTSWLKFGPLYAHISNGTWRVRGRSGLIFLFFLPSTGSWCIDLPYPKLLSCGKVVRINGFVSLMVMS